VKLQGMHKGKLFAIPGWGSSTTRCYPFIEQARILFLISKAWVASLIQPYGFLVLGQGRGSSQSNLRASCNLNMRGMCTSTAIRYDGLSVNKVGDQGLSVSLCNYPKMKSKAAPIRKGKLVESNHKVWTNT
jgi:hypothetical protein